MEKFVTPLRINRMAKQRLSYSQILKDAFEASLSECIKVGIDLEKITYFSFNKQIEEYDNPSSPEKVFFIYSFEDGYGQWIAQEKKP